MTEKTLDVELIEKADELLEEMNKPEWLLANDRRRPDSKQVKIAEGLYVIQKMAKTPGGLVRVTAINQDGHLHDVHLSGDFFFYPAASLLELEQALENVALDADDISKVVEDFYQQHEIESPGVVPADYGKLLTL